MTLPSRAFLYGDLLIESLAVRNGEVAHLSRHAARIGRGMQILGMEGRVDMDLIKQTVHDALQGAAHARVRLVVSRNGEGFYLSNSDGVTLDVSVHELPEAGKPVHQLGVYTTNRKGITDYGTLKTGNALLYTLAAKEARAQGWDDALLLNEHHRVCEATASNLFFFRNGVLYTPADTEGCVHGIMREVILERCSQVMEVKQCEVSPDELKGADELFLTNAVYGIMPVLAFAGRSLAREQTQALLERIQPL